MSSLPAPADQEEAPPPAWLWWCFAATIFVSAFLLFQVQPLISKVILPWFGGSPAVWTTCLLFFQVLLVVGYGYAFLLSLAPARWQGLVHLAPLAVALVMLPILPGDAWKPRDPTAPPALQILVLLAVCVGVPYFVLSTTGPLLQRWFSRVFPDQSPYRLYALSNIGSLGALISYPFIFEPWLGTGTQGIAWSMAFACFAALCGIVAFMAWRHATSGMEPARNDASLGAAAAALLVAPEGSSAAGTPPAAPAVPAEPKPAGDFDIDETQADPTIDSYVVWLLLPAVATVVLMAVTTHVTQDIAPVPLLWVLPLSLYLLTFIICFDHDAWYVRPFFALGAIASTLAVGSLMVAQQIDTLVGRWLDKLLGDDRLIPFVWWQWKFELFSIKAWRDDILIEAGCYFAMVFFVCMVCHGELARRKPGPSYLTLYFFLIAVGGALGGLYVALICPLVYSSYLELYQVIFIGMLVGMMALAIDGMRGWLQNQFLLRVALGSLALALLIYLGMAIYTAMQGSYLERTRTFYGVLTVVDDENDFGVVDGRSLRNGRILHGFQWLAPERSREPTTYYNHPSGFGMAATHFGNTKGRLRLAMVGLGTGTAACYVMKDDSCTFYEINPQVLRIAEEHFTYLKDARELGEVEVKLGDGRLSLEAEPGGKLFDVIALDAFSGDAIPAHLLTVEAFETYLKHLDPEGIIAVHVSNRYLNLVSVTAGIAREHKLEVVRIEADEEEAENTNATSSSTWMLVARDKKHFSQEMLDSWEKTRAHEEKRRKDGKSVEGGEEKPIVWTDASNDLFQVLK